MTKGWYFRFAVVALSGILAAFALWPSLGDYYPAPGWVRNVFSGRIARGLDISGGMRLAYEVEVDQALSDRRDRLKDQLLRRLAIEFGELDDTGRRPQAKKQAAPPQKQGQSAPPELEQGLEATRQRVQLSTANPPDGQQWYCYGTGETVRCRRNGPAPSLGPDSPWTCAPDGDAIACSRPTTEEDLSRIHATFRNAADAAKLSEDLLTRWFPDLREIDHRGNTITLAIRRDAIEKLRESAVKQTQETIENRIDELQVREISVSAQGNDIIVEVPGRNEEDFNRIRTIISRTARLEFLIVDHASTAIAEIPEASLPEGIERSTGEGIGDGGQAVSYEYLTARGDAGKARLTEYVVTLQVDEQHEIRLGAVGEDSTTTEDTVWQTYVLKRPATVTGEHIDDAYAGYDPQSSAPVVYINFNSEGAAAFDELTGSNVKKAMAIVLDNRVESAPAIRERIGGGRCQITLGGGMGGRDVGQEAQDLVVVLNAGALPAPIRPSNEQRIGPRLGADSVAQGTKGAVIGIALVVVLMAVYYEVAGLVAGLMVLLNVLLLLGVMAAIGATLTLPGIAGIALNVGMAVDANVLITERMREELRLGKSPRSAVENGFKRALSSIIDSQLTTLIATVVLYQFGTGPIKGFAVTLGFGILTSLFTGVFCSRVLFEWIVSGLRVKRLRVG